MYYTHNMSKKKQVFGEYVIMFDVNYNKEIGQYLIEFSGINDELYGRNRLKTLSDTFTTPSTSDERVAQLKKIDEKRQPHRKKGDISTKNEPHHAAFLQALTNRLQKRPVRSGRDYAISWATDRVNVWRSISAASQCEGQSEGCTSSRDR